MQDSDVTAFVPELLYTNGRFERGRALVCGDGRVLTVLQIEPPGGSDEDVRRGVENSTGPRRGRTKVIRLRERAMLPGMVNAHSHAFQRVMRGRTEYRGAHARDSFWTWREMMYEAAARLTPEDIYDASRMAFLEMAAGGVTSVGEFHYLHRTLAGAEYDDPNLLSKEVVRAARDVGLRIALLRVAYARAGFRAAADDRQLRFIEPDPDTFLRNTDALARDLASEEDADSEAGAGRRLPRVWVGVAPHSVRAVPVEYFKHVNLFAVGRGMPVHAHVAEQPAEVEACVAETGRTPLALLADEGVPGPHFTAVHAIHVTAEEVAALRDAGARVCACPTTERNLGDGVVPADLFFDAGVSVALGTDSHAQIDLLEDARELEYHLRLLRRRRNVLAPARGVAFEKGCAAGDVEGGRAEDEGTRVEDEGARRGSDAAPFSSLAARLFECATVSGARSIGAPSGEFAPGRAADFFTVGLEDPSVAGASVEDLLPAIVFSLSRAAVRDVAVGGRLVVEGGAHAAQREIVSRFAALQRRLWSET